MKPQLVLFDIDHTLVDVLAFHEPAYTSALKEVYGVDARLRDIQFSGMTTPNIVCELARLSGVPGEKVEAGLPRALEVLARDIIANLDGDLRESILPGASEVLEALRADAICLGIVTGNPRAIGEEVLRRTHLLPYFAVRVYGDEAAERWQLAALAVERARQLVATPIEAHNVVVVGDSPHDVRAGKRVGAATVAIGTGLHAHDTLAASEPDVLLADLADYRAAYDAIITAHSHLQVADARGVDRRRLASDAATPP